MGYFPGMDIDDGPVKPMGDRPPQNGMSNDDKFRAWAAATNAAQEYQKFANTLLAAVVNVVHQYERNAAMLDKLHENPALADDPEGLASANRSRMTANYLRLEFKRLANLDIPEFKL